MPLKAYALGQNIVAAETAEQALVVMERHEQPGRWLLEDVRELTEEERYAFVDDAGTEYINDALARCEANLPNMRREGVPGQLIRWDYPTA